MADTRYPLHVYDYEAVDISSADYTPPAVKNVIGFHANSTGTVMLRPKDGDPAQACSVIAGASYAYPFTSLISLNSTATDLLVLFDN